MTFQIKRWMDTGTANPIVARTTLGLFDVIQMARIEDSRKEAIKGACFDIMKFLVEAEKVAAPIMSAIREVEHKIATEGIRLQYPSGAIETPTAGELEGTRTFLKFAKQALQSLAVGMGALLEKEFKGPHFDKILVRAREMWGADHVVVKLLEEDQGWLKEINNLRNEDEHPKSGKSFVEDFDVQKMPDGKLLVRPPRFFNGDYVLKCLEIYSHNLLTFTEEMIAHGLATYLPEPVCLVEIPEDQRDPSAPVRYRLGLRGPLPGSGGSQKTIP